MKVSRSLTKRIRNAGFVLTVDQAFSRVLDHCAAPRRDATGTWITAEMKTAYLGLHEAGLAHSFETYLEGELVGGLYGVSLGLCFFGESMFSLVPDGSKIAFQALHHHLSVWEFDLIDCQLQNPHLESLGVYEMPRSEFLHALRANPLEQTRRGRWHLD